MTKIKVSVIVPAYNAEKYLIRCIESVLNQKYPFIELILVDDGSTDKTGTICDSYRNKYENIKVVHKLNGGLSSARNAGLDIISGDYIFFLDSDDWIENDYIDKCILEIVKNKVDILITPYIREYDNKSIKNSLFKDEIIIFENNLFYNGIYKRLFGPYGNQIKSPVRMDNLSTAWGKFYRKYYVLNQRFASSDKVGNSEDLWFNICTLFKMHKAEYYGSVYYHYNKSNSESIVSTYNSKLFLEWKNLYATMKQFIQKNMLDYTYYEALNNRIVLNIFSLIYQIFISDLTFIKKIRISNEILKDEIYKNAFASFNYENMEYKWKIFYKLARLKVTIGLFAMCWFARFLREKVRR